jgi:hypothetical protein
LAGAAITLGSEKVTTDSSGQYRLTADPGSFTITASLRGFQNGVAAVTIPPAATTTQNFALAKAVGTIFGNVIDSDRGEPIEGATVSVVAATQSTTTNASGDYTLTNVPAGSDHVTASAGVSYLSDSRAVQVMGNQTVRVDLVLRRRHRPPGQPT